MAKKKTKKLKRLEPPENWLEKHLAGLGDRPKRYRRDRTTMFWAGWKWITRLDPSVTPTPLRDKMDQYLRDNPDRKGWFTDFVEKEVLPFFKDSRFVESIEHVCVALDTIWDMYLQELKHEQDKQSASLPVRDDNTGQQTPVVEDGGPAAPRNVQHRRIKSDSGQEPA